MGKMFRDADRRKICYAACAIMLAMSTLIPIPWIKPAIMCALEVLGSDRVLFGSDFPITPSILGRERGLDTIYSLPVPSEVKTAILGGSAVKLLQL